MKRYTVYANDRVQRQTDNVNIAYSEYNALIRLSVMNCYIIDNATCEVITD